MHWYCCNNDVPLLNATLPAVIYYWLHSAYESSFSHCKIIALPPHSYVSGLIKTDHIVTFCISKNNDLRHCSSLKSY